ncbi:hypothetical protein Pmar_PMAR008195 [Perkinsus marinus ATCC 50983]|uniref:Uncharacterized protein n=1 Tax=Perkinsus marinus (strain ATCC 50983 / TXsc) TaxID=423536 RepID=C5LNH8_PERM5|nr:hypothetical protein Pmar_PMAR008195 [Perkinsus marinus ATCC 50983]EER01729.1 hypothetical protein Pmar_PMAR008195 [Perkinsus marinus ATCC 50983]|eukprot:XP_002769011.1 hypothetical protein Pmar_PMAR008195 [Perkinsus marinus ATCC 50983]
MGEYYDDPDGDVSGKLTFYPDYILNIHVNLYGCAISVSGVKYSQLIHVGMMNYKFTISYAGTDLANQINACKSSKITIKDFDEPLLYTYRTIEPKRNSITTSWGPTTGLFFHEN